MSIAQRIHALVSFVFGEEEPRRKPETDLRSAREIFSSAATVEDCLRAYGLAKDGELPDERVFDRLERVARSSDDWLYAMKEVGASSVLGKRISLYIATRLSLPLDAWEGVYRHPQSDNELRAVAVEKMFSLASTFAELDRLYAIVTEPDRRKEILTRLGCRAATLEEKVRVYDLSAGDTAFHEAVYNDIMAGTKTFDDWDKVFSRAEPESSLEHLAATKLIELAPDTLTDLVDLLGHDAISGDDELRDSVFSRLKQVNAPFEEWKKVFEDTEGGSELESFLATMVAENAPEDVEMLADVIGYDVIYGDPKLYDAVLEKLKRTNGSFDDWKAVKVNNERDEAKEIAAEKMIVSVTNIGEVRDAVEAFDGDEDAQEKLVARMKTLNLIKSDLESILDDYDNEHFLFAAVVDLLAEKATTALECLELYRGWDMQSNEEDTILTKLFSLASPEECRIIELASDDDSTLRSWAERVKK